MYPYIPSIGEPQKAWFPSSMLRCRGWILWRWPETVQACYQILGQPQNHPGHKWSRVSRVGPCPSANLPRCRQNDLAQPRMLTVGTRYSQLCCTQDGTASARWPAKDSRKENSAGCLQKGHARHRLFSQPSILELPDSSCQINTAPNGLDGLCYSILSRA